MTKKLLILFLFKFISSICHAYSFSVVDKDGLINKFPHSEYIQSYSPKVMQTLMLETKNEDISNDFDINRIIKSCYIETDCGLNDYIKELDLKKISREETFNLIADHVDSCSRKEKEIDKLCIEKVSNTVVTDWINFNFTEKVFYSAPVALESSLFPIYLDFTKEFYQYFKNPQNTALLNRIFYHAKNDLLDFIQNKNHKSNDEKQMVSQIVENINLEKYFEPRSPFVEHLVAIRKENTVLFGPSFFFKSINPEFVYFFLLHEMSHFFDPCPDSEGKYNKHLSSFEDYFFEDILLLLKKEYKTQNKFDLIGSKPENFQEYICSDQLVELVPDWIANQVFKLNYNKYGFQPNNLLNTMSEFFNQPDPEGYEDSFYKQHISDSERMRMTDRIINEGLNF